MSISASVAALRSAKSAIASAIAAKGGAVASDDGFADFAAAIASIPSGGGDRHTAIGSVEVTDGIFTLTGLSFTPGSIMLVSDITSRTSGSVFMGYAFGNSSFYCRQFTGFSGFASNICSAVYTQGGVSISDVPFMNTTWHYVAWD